MSMNVFQHIVFPGRGNSVKIQREGRRLKIAVEGATPAERVVIEVDVTDADLEVKGLR